MTGKPETALQTAIVKALRQLGVWVIVMNVTKRRGKRGVSCGEPWMPDLWTEYGWLEVKLPDEGVLSDDQKAWHARAIRHGVNVETVMSPMQAVDAIRHWRKATLSSVNRASRI
jgi:hypothetical protein